MMKIFNNALFIRKKLRLYKYGLFGNNFRNKERQRFNLVTLHFIKTYERI